MGRNPKIKLFIKTDKELNKITHCGVCGVGVKYRNAYFKVDESNISITNNAVPICKTCKNQTK